MHCSLTFDGQFEYWTAYTGDRLSDSVDLDTLHGKFSTIVCSTDCHGAGKVWGDLGWFLVFL